MKKLASCFVLLCCALPALAQGATTVTWVLPTTRINDAPLAPAELSAVRVYVGTAGAIPLPGTATSWVVPSCVKSTVTVTAVDTNGLESPMATPAVSVNTLVASVCAPKAPSGVKVTTTP